MGLTNQSTGIDALKEMFEVELESPDDVVIALAGNPNTGKSTVFNNLTGLNQHTGNWPGKTVSNAQGKYTHKDKQYVLVDLPGTYSLLANSVEEQIARDFICFGNPHATVVVTDATSLERNLNLVLQIMEITDKVVICVNLMDEAERKDINVDLIKLEKLLGVPVVGTAARNGEGLNELKDTIKKVASGEIQTNSKKVDYGEVLEDTIKQMEPHIHNLIKDRINNRWVSLRLIDGDDELIKSINNYIGFDLSKDEFINNKLEDLPLHIKNKYAESKDLRDHIVSSIIKTGENISKEVVTFPDENHNKLDQK